jgi:hypothetical protein
MADHNTRRSSDPNEPDNVSRSREHKVQAPATDQARALFDCVPATVWTTDSKLVLTFVEGVLLRRLKISPDRILGRTLFDLLLDGREDHPLIQGHLTALAGHENTVRIEWGGDIYSARLAPLRDAAGEVAGVAGVQQQIGWLPDEDTLLREGDIRLRRAFDANIAGIVAIELLAAAQGVDLRRPLKTSEKLAQAVATIRADVPFWDRDRAFAPDLEAIRRRVEAGDFVSYSGQLFA